MTALAPSVLPVARALLGLRFVDFATGRVVESGLRVTARPADQLDRPRPGVVGPSGVVSFHHLPGLHDLEFPLPGAPPSAPPLPRPFVITVEDRRGWFLRTLFLIDLPLFAPGSLPRLLDRPVDAFLFSAPARPVPPGFAAIRAQLQDAITATLVGHAVLRVELAGTTGVGIADASGHVLVLLPAPTLDRLRLGSPPGMGQAILGRQTWPVTIRAFALPGLAPPAFPAGRLPDPWHSLPTLRAILDTQPQAPVHLAPGTIASTWTDTLTYGDDLVLRTQTSSYLMISPGASLP